MNPINILEVGVGNKTVSNYLRFLKYAVDTCDFDPDLKPDYLADVRSLPFQNEEYACILVCQVLEHIPFSDFSQAL